MEIGAATRPKPGELVSGDTWASWPCEQGRVFAVIDGLGHGPHAAAAALTAKACIEENLGLGPGDMLRRCDEQMRGTRGAAITILSIQSDGRMTHAGVGNVDLVSRTAQPIRAVSSPGVVGGRSGRVRETAHSLRAGDLLVVYTDGISSRFSLQDYVALAPQEIAEALMADHGKDHDDATCLVIRY